MDSGAVRLFLVLWFTQLLHISGLSRPEGPSQPGGINEYVHYKSSLKIQHLAVALDKRVAFQYNASRFDHNRQLVEVSWSGVYHPQEWDHLALYAGQGFIDPKATLPVQVGGGERDRREEARERERERERLPVQVGGGECK